MAAVNSIEGVSSPSSPTLSLSTQYEYISKSQPPLQKSLCKIFRRKNFGGFLDLGSHYYEMYIEGTNTNRTFLLSGLKKKNAKTSTYLISLTKFDSEREFKKGIIGKVKSNFFGTVFTIYDDYRLDDDQIVAPKLSLEMQSVSTSSLRLAKSESHLHADKEMAVVMYEPNLLGLNGPRKVTVILPAITRSNVERLMPMTSDTSLYSKFKREEHDKVLVLQNKVPQWSEETQSYVLNFHGRVTHASVKNFQLVHENDYDYIVMQFGRIGTDAFTIDFQYPISAFMAFAIAMTSFDDKLACE